MNKDSKNVKELKSDLEQFRRSIGKFEDIEDELHIIALELNGDSIKSPRIKNDDESKYQSGTTIYKNEICDLMEYEEQLIKSRNYYLYRIRKVASFLQTLTERQVQIIELRYWSNFSIRIIGKALYISKSSVCRELDTIFEKWDMSQQK